MALKAHGSWDFDRLADDGATVLRCAVHQLESWHVVVLNSNCDRVGCDITQPTWVAGGRTSWASRPTPPLSCSCP